MGRKGKSLRHRLPMKGLFNRYNPIARGERQMPDEKTPASDKPKLAVEPSPLLANRRTLLPHDDEATSRWPKVVSLMLPRYDAFSRLTREPGSITIRPDGGMWRIVMSCPTEGVQCIYGSTSLTLVLDDFEAHIGSENCNWTENYESLKKAKQRLKDMLGS